MKEGTYDLYQKSKKKRLSIAEMEGSFFFFVIFESMTLHLPLLAFSVYLSGIFSEKFVLDHMHKNW